MRIRELKAATRREKEAGKEGAAEGRSGELAHTESAYERSEDEDIEADGGGAGDIAAREMARNMTKGLFLLSPSTYPMHNSVFVGQARRMPPRLPSYLQMSWLSSTM